MGFDGSFVILDFPPLPAPYPDAAEDRMVYVDTLTGALYLERPAEISAYSAAYEQLQAVALAPQPSSDTLRKISPPSPSRRTDGRPSSTASRAASSTSEQLARFGSSGHASADE